MKKINLIRFIAFTAVFSLIFAFVSCIYTQKQINPIKTNGYSSTMAGFYNEPKNSLDVIQIGTSRIKTSIFPPAMWDESGITAYNLATPGQSAVLGYYALSEAIKYQTPSVAIIYAEWLFRDSESDKFESRARQFFDAMPLSANKLAYIKDMLLTSEKQSFLSYLFPLIRYHDRKKLNEGDFDLFYRFKRHPLRGGTLPLYSSKISYPDNFMTDDYDAAYIVNPEDFDRIVQLCKSQNVEIVIVEPPTVNNSRWSLAKHREVQSYADRQDIAFIDFNYNEYREAVRIDPSTDFADGAHTNAIGASKVSRYLANYLSETFDLPDRRNEDYDPHWDEVMDYYNYHYNRFLDRQQIILANDLSEYLLKIRDYSDCYVLVSAIGDFTKYFTVQDRNALQEFGLQTDFSAVSDERAYYAVIDNGKIIGEEYSAETVELMQYLKPFDITVRSAVTYGVNGKPSYTSRITTNTTQRSKNKQGINIVVYDKLHERFVDAVCFGTHDKEIPVSR